MPDKIELPMLSKGDLRCECGNLVARITESGIELKCRRCKRIKIIARPAVVESRAHLKEEE